MVNEVLPSMVPDGFIYLRATPDVCNTRMVMRNRSEETGIARDYLENLHDKHEQWLNGSRPWVRTTLLLFWQACSSCKSHAGGPSGRGSIKPIVPTGIEGLMSECMQARSSCILLSASFMSIYARATSSGLFRV